MKRNGSAEWSGVLKSGCGVVSTESGVLKNAQYSFGTRFDNDPGTNPEELIAAAHAACFSMALAAIVEREELKNESIKTTATVTLEKSEDGYTIPAIHIQVIAKIPDINEVAFIKLANEAKKGCPVSQLMNAEITLDAKLAAGV